MPAQRVSISDTNIWIDFGRVGLEARGLVVEVLPPEAVEALFGLMGEHGNSALADVSCCLVAKTQGVPLLTGDGAPAQTGRQGTACRCMACCGRRGGCAAAQPA